MDALLYGEPVLLMLITRQVWANSVDPNSSGYTLSALWMHYCMVNHIIQNLR